MIINWPTKRRNISSDGVVYDSYACFRTNRHGNDFCITLRDVTLITNDSGDTCTVSEGQTTDTPEASDDDDGGDADSDPDGRPPHKTPIPQPANGSASKQRTRAPRLPAGQIPEFQVIGVTEFDLAESIGMSVEFLRKDRSGKRLIPFYRIGASIRYNPTRVIEALARLEVGGYAPKPKATKARQSTLTAG